MEEQDFANRMAEQPDHVLLAIVGAKSADYQPSAIAAARLEIARRGIEVPPAETIVKRIAEPVAAAPQDRTATRNGFFCVRLAANNRPQLPRKCICCDATDLASPGVTIGSVAGKDVEMPACTSCRRHWQRLRWRGKLIAQLGIGILLFALGIGMRQDLRDLTMGRIAVLFIALAVPLFAIALAVRFFTQPGVGAAGHAALDRQPAEMQVNPPYADYCFSRRGVAMEFGALNALTADELRGLNG